MTVIVTPSGKYYLGYKPDLMDVRDLKYSVPPHVLAKGLPPKVDLLPGCAPVLNQGELGSCVSNAVAGAMQFDFLRQKHEMMVPSRLFIYYNIRVLENSVNEDSGAEIRDGIKAVNKQGACNEKLWKYDIKRFKVKPSKEAYEEAKGHEAVKYARIYSDLEAMKGCLASGFPFVFGVALYQSFESSKTESTGVVEMPGSKEKAIGGHAMLAVGYDDETKRFLIRNSWGEQWGKKGNCTMPYEYLTNSDLCDDRWNITLIN